jgi:MFS family permease
MSLCLALLCLVANLLVRAGLHPPPPATSKPTSLRTYFPRLRIFADPAFALTTAGVFCMEWGLFIPVAYITSFVISAHVGSASTAFTTLAVLNAGSAVGRFLPGIFADRVGRFNAMIVLLAMCGLTTLAIWLPAAVLSAPSSSTTTITASSATKPLVLSYALLFGFASGANISLTPVCVGQLCATAEYGRYYASCYVVVSAGTLTGIPIAGALMQACGGEYYGVVVFTSACYLLSLGAFVGARVVRVGWRVRDREGGWVIF